LIDIMLCFNERLTMVIKAWYCCVGHCSDFVSWWAEETRWFTATFWFFFKLLAPSFRLTVQVNQP